MSVYLVGAGPGDPELLTVRAARLISEADCLVVDRLVPDGIRSLARLDAEIIDVGKWPGGGSSQEEIHRVLISAAERFRVVVRLKGGDPFVFARGSEELEALAAAGLQAEIVPGLTSALAGPALVGIPVTRRGVARFVTIATAATEDPDGPVLTFPPAPNPEGTLVVLMGVQRRAALSRELIACGWDPHTPVAAIESASLPTQRVIRMRLETLGSTEIVAPAVLVIGEVARDGLLGEAPQSLKVD